MNKKEYFGCVIVACFFTLLVNIGMVIHYSDNISKVFGYFITLIILPFIFASIPSTVIISVSSAKLSAKQKLWLYLWPFILIGLILTYYGLMLSYGGPH